jgi:hypothetical protein
MVGWDDRREAIVQNTKSGKVFSKLASWSDGAVGVAGCGPYYH